MLAAEAARLRLTILAVELAGHRADETRRAVAALGAATIGHLALYGVEVVGRTQSFGGHDLLAVEPGRRHQACVDRRPSARVRTVRFGDQHGAGAALALGAAFLAPGEAGVAQPVEQRYVPADLAECCGVDR